MYRRSSYIGSRAYRTSIQVINKDAAEFERRINLVSPQSNKLRDHTDALTLQPPSTAADTGVTKLEERMNMVNILKGAELKLQPAADVEVTKKNAAELGWTKIRPHGTRRHC
jgi:hypothetical protein